MKRRVVVLLALIVAVVVVSRLPLAPSAQRAPSGGANAGATALPRGPSAPSVPVRDLSAQSTERSTGGSRVGFRSRQLLAEHFEKHGREFPGATIDDYLRMAQALRDRPAGGQVLELARTDGVITRFDRASGAFIAFNSDLTIRTFFRPRDGESYFRRQARRAGR